MSTSPKSEILCVGDNTVDIFVDRATMYPGGNAVNVAAGVARLGGRAHYIGCVSQDRYGELVYNSLKSEGVDLALCRRSPGPSPKALVGHRGNDRYFIGSMPGVRADYELLGSDYALMSQVDIVHTSVYSELDGKIARMAEASKVLSYDFSNKWLDHHLEYAPFVNIAFLSAPGRDQSACVELMQRWAVAGASLIVMTRGEDGAMALQDGKIYLQGIISADVVDTLGAGDGFIAGFLASYGISRDVATSLAAGAQSAAQACQLMGGYGYGADHPWEIPNLPSAGLKER